MTYLTTLIVFGFVWVNYAQMVKLRWQWFRSEEYQNSLHARSIIVCPSAPAPSLRTTDPTVQITQVAKQARSDAGIAQLLNSLAIPYPTTAVHIGRRVGQLPELIEAHNGAVRALEGVLTRYFKDPERLPTNRPTIRIGATMGCGGKKVVRVDSLAVLGWMWADGGGAGRDRSLDGEDQAVRRADRGAFPVAASAKSRS